MTAKSPTQSFVLEPYVGAGKVRFGMRRSDVSALLGVPDVVDLSGLGERNEYRGALRVAFQARPSPKSDASCDGGVGSVF